MIKIQLNNFQDGVECKSILFTSKEGFNKVTHKFTSGKVYGFVGDFGCGSWGLVNCLGGRCTQPSGEVLLNDKLINCQELLKHSCFISESIYEGINSTEEYLTPKKCIEKALQVNGLSYDVEEIRRLFGLSGPHERFERDLRYVGVEIWRISMAIGFAYGKEIFCFPWLNEREISMLSTLNLDVLKKNGKIVLIPSSQIKPLKKLCDEVLIFKGDKIITK